MTVSTLTDLHLYEVDKILRNRFKFNLILPNLFVKKITYLYFMN